MSNDVEHLEWLAFQARLELVLNSTEMFTENMTTRLSCAQTTGAPKRYRVARTRECGCRQCTTSNSENKFKTPKSDVRSEKLMHVMSACCFVSCMPQESNQLRTVVDKRRYKAPATN